jgi:hypothetical protein
MSTAVQDIHDVEHGQPAEVEEKPQLVALLGEFRDVSVVTEAARKVREAGFVRFDVHSPFPIHGIDAVMGTRPTGLPWLVLGAGLFGLGGGIWLQWFANDWAYNFPISGKPFWSFPANIPVAFECTILCASLMAVFGMLGLNRLPTLYNPIFKIDRFRRVTNDRFFIYLDAADPAFNEQRSAELLQRVGATAVERVED